MDEVYRRVRARSNALGPLSPRVPAAPLSRVAQMRIAIVTDYYYPALGGISEHVDGQARALTDLGHDVTVVTGEPTRPPAVRDGGDPPPEPNFEIVRMGRAVPLYVPRWGNQAQ